MYNSSLIWAKIASIYELLKYFHHRDVTFINTFAFNEY